MSFLPMPFNIVHALNLMPSNTFTCSAIWLMDLLQVGGLAYLMYQTLFLYSQTNPKQMNIKLLIQTQLTVHCFRKHLKYKSQVKWVKILKEGSGKSNPPDFICSCLSKQSKRNFILLVYISYIDSLYFYRNKLLSNMTEFLLLPYFCATFETNHSPHIQDTICYYPKYIKKTGLKVWRKGEKDSPVVKGT